MPFLEPIGNSTPRDDLNVAYVDYEPEEKFIARELLPDMDVSLERGNILTVSRESYLTHVNTRRARGAKTAQSNIDLGEETFRLVEFGHMGEILEEDVRLYGGILPAEEIQTEINRFKVDLDYELLVAAAVFSPVAFPLSGNTGFEVDNEWDTANGVPISDINEAKRLGEERGEPEYNTLVITSDTWRNLGTNAQIVDRLKARSDSAIDFDKGTFPAQALASIFEVERVLIAKSVYLDPEDGTYKRAWSDEYALLTRTSSGRNVKLVPQLGRTMTLPGFDGMLMESWEEPNPPARYVRSRQLIDPHLFGEAGRRVGVLLGNVSTTPDS